MKICLSGRKSAKRKEDGDNDENEKNILFHNMNVLGFSILESETTHYMMWFTRVNNTASGLGANFCSATKQITMQN